MDRNCADRWTVSIVRCVLYCYFIKSLVVLVFTWLTYMQLLAINVAVKKVLFTTVVGMVIMAMEHLLCKVA